MHNTRTAKDDAGEVIAPTRACHYPCGMSSLEAATAAGGGNARTHVWARIAAINQIACAQPTSPFLDAAGWAASQRIRAG